MIQNPYFPEIHGNFGFGCMRLPMKDGKVNYDEFCRMVDAFIASGLNYFDMLVTGAGQISMAIAGGSGSARKLSWATRRSRTQTPLPRS